MSHFRSRCLLCFALALLLPVSQFFAGLGEQKIQGATGMTINENAIYRIVNKSTGKVIDIPNAGNENGTLLQTYTSNGTAAQQFKFIPSVNQGYYCIVPMCAKSKAFDDPSYSKDSGKVHQIYQQNGEGAQDYQITDAGNGYVRIISKPSGYALTDDGNVKQFAVANDDRQLWRLEVVRSSNCFTNPIRSDGADPWVFKAGNSYYYCQSSGGVALYKMNDLTQLGISQYNNIFVNDYVGSETLTSYWAPECIYLRGHWYSYFAPEVNRGGNDSHRTYVLEGGTNPDNPLDGKYTLKGRLADSTNKWSIDTTAFEYGGRLYCVWSGWEGDTNVAQKIYIAEMSNPWTISSNRVCISTPTYGWETNTNPQVNEGPEVLIKNGKVHIIYSASGSWTDSYCLGRLTCTNGDFLNPNSWTKGSEPVFQQTATVHGVGHASFTKSPDGTEDWIVYHAAKRSGGGWDRDIHMQMFTWHDDYPFFGTPVSNDVELANPSKSSESPVNSNHYYIVKNVATGRCLDIPNGEDKNSLKLQTWDINHSNAQQFKFTKKTTGWYTMSPKCATGRGIDNPSGSTGTGIQYQTWELNNNKAQNFRLEKVADGTYRIINQASLYALTDNGSSAGYKVTQEALTNDNNQRWTLIDQTALDETTTPEPTTQEPTTVSDGYTTGEAGQWTASGKWGLYYGAWSNALASYKTGSSPAFSVKVRENTKGITWLIQASYTDDVTAGHTYKVTANVTPTKNARIGIKEDLSNGTAGQQYTDCPAGVATNLTGTYKVSQDKIKIMFELGEGVDSDTIINFNSIRLEDVTPVETTTAEPTTVEPTTVEPTTAEPTTKPIETTTEAKETVTVVNQGLEVNGYQISATLKGFRAIYSVDPSINGKTVVESGLIYCLRDYCNEDDIYVREDHPYVKAFPGKIALSHSYSDSFDATSYAMTLAFASGSAKEFTTPMAVRAYAKLSDGSYVYTKTCNYTLYSIAQLMYNRHLMTNEYGHNYLYQCILKVVNPDYQKDPFDYTSALCK